jgi:hypothetical protein
MDEEVVFLAFPDNEDLPLDRLIGPQLLLLVGNPPIVDVDPAAPNQTRGFTL